jgi:uncharacterized protein HemY
LTQEQQAALAERVQKLSYYDNPINCREALKRNPDDPDAHARLGRLGITKDPAQSVIHFKTALRVRPHDRHAAVMLGSALKRAVRTKEAADVWREVARQQDSAGQAAQKHLDNL